MTEWKKLEELERLKTDPVFNAKTQGRKDYLEERWTKIS
jgi:hypothetical protein